jgi:hypothetical protein
MHSNQSQNAKQEARGASSRAGAPSQYPPRRDRTRASPQRPVSAGYSETGGLIRPDAPPVDSQRNRESKRTAQRSSTSTTHRRNDGNPTHATTPKTAYKDTPPDPPCEPEPPAEVAQAAGEAGFRARGRTCLVRRRSVQRSSFAGFRARGRTCLRPPSRVNGFVICGKNKTFLPVTSGVSAF